MYDVTIVVLSRGRGTLTRGWGRDMARGTNMVKYKMSLNENTFLIHHVDNNE